MPWIWVSRVNSYSEVFKVKEGSERNSWVDEGTQPVPHPPNRLLHSQVGEAGLRRGVC